MIDLIQLVPIVISTVGLTILWKDAKQRSILEKRLEEKEKELKETLKGREDELKQALEKIAVSHNNLHSRCEELGDKVGELTLKTSAMISQLSPGGRR